jgi:hypothetical protein
MGEGSATKEDLLRWCSLPFLQLATLVLSTHWGVLQQYWNPFGGLGVHAINWVLGAVAAAAKLQTLSLTAGHKVQLQSMISCQLQQQQQQEQELAKTKQQGSGFKQQQQQQEVMEVSDCQQERDVGCVPQHEQPVSPTAAQLQDIGGVLHEAEVS